MRDPARGRARALRAFRGTRVGEPAGHARQLSGCLSLLQLAPQRPGRVATPKTVPIRWPATPGTDGRRIRRQPGARFFVPTEDEWYKAAYYDPHKPGGAGYWNYPTRSDDAAGSGCRFGSTARTTIAEAYLDPQRYFVEVGTFRRAASAYGTFDQAGNALEWTEGLVPPFLRCAWGGAFDMSDGGRNQRAPNRHYTSALRRTEYRLPCRCSGGRVPLRRPSTDCARDRFDHVRRRRFSPPPLARSRKRQAVLSARVVQLPERRRGSGQSGPRGRQPGAVRQCAQRLDTDEQLRENIERMRKYLDHARQRDIKVLVQLAGWYGGHMRQRCGRDRTSTAMDGRRSANIPALFGYQLYDEPEYKAGGGLGVEDQRQLRRICLGLAPEPRHVATMGCEPASHDLGRVQPGAAVELDRLPAGHRLVPGRSLSARQGTGLFRPPWRLGAADDGLVDGARGGGTARTSASPQSGSLHAGRRLAAYRERRAGSLA